MSLAILLLGLLSTVEARDTVSLQAAPLLAGGVTLQAERSTPTLRWSFATSLGVRASAAGDYRAFNLSLGLEARRWWHVGPLSSAPLLGSVGGLLAWGRIDAVWVRLEHLDGTSAGATVRGGLSAGVGYRLLPGWRFELTPVVGAGLDVATNQVSAVFGLTVGVMF